MIKTLIVDDDFLVRMFLKQITDWQGAGFILIEDACNGKEAFSIVERELPELVITDLSMPVVDGISLIKRIREISTDIYIVALSCHDEFEFVKEAMRMGADEYILKNLLNEEVLLKILESSRIKIDKTQAIRQEKDELQRLAKKGSELLRQELFEELIKCPYSLEEQKELCVSAGVSYSFRRCAAVAAYAEQTPGNILQPVCEQYCRNKNAVCIGKAGNSCCILLDLSEIHSQADQLDLINTFADGIGNCISNYLNTKAAIGISSVSSGDGGLHIALDQAKKALEYRFYGSRIYRYADLAFYKNFPLEALALTEFFKGKADSDDRELYRLSTAAFASLKNAFLEPDVVRNWFSALLISGAYPEEFPETLDKMEELWTSHTANRKRKDTKEEQQCGNQAISQAVSYIRKHYNEPISLLKVANEVHLNASYLSYLFKQEMGVNFSDYLIHCRLERVKTLIRESNQPIKECAGSAGFQDYRNFCKLFKKVTGMRPAEYRNLKK